MAKPLRKSGRIVLTGAPDALPDLNMPVRSFTVRMFDALDTTLTATIPYNGDLFEGVNSRPNGLLDLYLGDYMDDGSVSEALFGSFAQDWLTYSRGAARQSFTIGGVAAITYSSPVSRTLTSLFSADNDHNDEKTWVFPFSDLVYPGDTLNYGSLQLIASEVFLRFSPGESQLSLEATNG